MGPVGYIVLALGLYLAIGLVVGAAFVAKGVTKIDPAAAGTSWAWRLLILPGAAALWPVMLKKWVAARRGGE